MTDHVTGSLTHVLSTDAEFDAALTGFQDNPDVTVVSSDAQTRTIVISLDVTR